MAPARELPRGVRRHGPGLQANVKVGSERSYEQFDRDAPLSEITRWQKDERARLQLLVGDRPRAGTLTADARRYLTRPAVTDLVDYEQRVQHIDDWCAVLGAKRRRSRGWKEAIEAQRDHWLTAPRGVIERDGTTIVLPPYAPNSVNKRLRALSNLWTELDGRRAPNPVLEVRECEEPDPEARGLPYDVIEAILAAIPEAAVGKKKDGTRTIGKPRPSQNKARLRVIAYTGLAHSTLKRLTRANVTLFPLDADGQETGGTLLLPPRKKGRKRRRAQDKPLPELVPLLPLAAAAFRRFDALDCWGPFSNSSMWKAFQRACAQLGLEDLTPYDFRHSFLSVVYAETRDLRVTGQLGSHRSDRTTKRYTLAAVAPHVQAAIEKVNQRFRLAPGFGTHSPKQDENS